MEAIRLNPTNLKGTVTVPCSKSIAHRALIAQALAGAGHISNLTFSEDLFATQKGIKNIMQGDTEVIDCGASGSTLRFLLPIALAFGVKKHFIGTLGLAKRPIEFYLDMMQSQGINFTCDSKQNFSLFVHGKLKAGTFNVPGNVSSQYITGLMFALPLLNDNSQINIQGRIESESYIMMTINVLKSYGIKIKRISNNSFSIDGNQKYKSVDFIVEGDYSNASFWLSAGLLSGPITVKGLSNSKLQGDRVVLDLLSSMGGKMDIHNNGSITVYPSKLHCVDIDVIDCPDLVPIFAVVGSLTPGITRINNATRLRLKESDRLSVLTNELRKLGVQITEKKDGLEIIGKEYIKGGVVDSCNDHRIAMAFAIAAIKCDSPLEIKNADCVKKSYPDFWKDYKYLGGLYE